MKDSSSSHLVILVVLVCLVGGGWVLYPRKLQLYDVDDVVYGGATTEITETPVSDDWTESLQLSEEEYTLIVEGLPHSEVPSQCRLRAQIVGATGNLLFSEEFSGGWPGEVQSGNKSSHTEAGPGLLELQCRRFIHERDIATQYYRVLKNRVVLVRLEDSDGRYVRNDYLHPNDTIGPKMPERGPQDWEASLSSEDPAEVLWALGWLGGEHGPPLPKRVAELTSSSNPWIAEAAKAAVHRER
jgi:hypothetical protein